MSSHLVRHRVVPWSLTAACLLLAACGANEPRAPFARDERDEDATDSNEASDDNVDDGTSDDDVDEPVVNAGGENPTVTTNPAWVAGPESWPADCDSFDPNRVYLYGVIAAGNQGRGTDLGVIVDGDIDGDIEFDRFPVIGDPEDPA